MEILIPFVLSSIIPGLGELYNRDYLKGFIFIGLLVMFAFLNKLIPFTYPYLFLLIISLTDIYLKAEKTVGRARAIRNLIFGLIVVTIIIPSIFYLFGLSLFTGGVYVTDQFLNDNHTEIEMIEIGKALDKYHLKNKRYPSDYHAFVNSKPIWNHWLTDAWENKYRYETTGEGRVHLGIGWVGWQI